MGNKGCKLCACCCPNKKTRDEENDEKTSVILPAIVVTTEDAKTEDMSDDDQRLVRHVTGVIDIFLEQASRPVTEDMGLELIVEKEHIRVYGRDTNRGFLLRSEWLIAYEPEVFIRFLSNIDLRLRWDKKMESLHPIKNIPPDYGVYYQTYKKIMLLAQRDLVYISKTFSVGEAWVDVCSSVDIQEVREVKDVVRMKLYMGGYFVQPLPSHLGKMTSKVVCVSECDFGGSIPKAIVKKVSAITIPSYVRELEDALRNYLNT